MTDGKDNSFGVELKIEMFEHAELSNGENVTIFYSKIFNKSSDVRKFKIKEASYLTRHKEHLEQDIWLNGYMMGEEIINPNCFKKTGHVFSRAKLKKVLINDSIYIPVELPHEGLALTHCFKNRKNGWVLVDIGKEDIKIKLTKEQCKKQLLNRVERLEVFEERLGVIIQNISLKINDYEIILFCELYPINGTAISDSIDVECVLYDREGSIIDKSNKYVISDDFFGFEVINMTFIVENTAELINKIRIYPKKL